MKAVVLLSGGQDSATCLMYALAKYEEVFAISFDYGQKHGIELSYAKQLASHFEVPHKVFDMRGLLPESALTNHSLDINAAHAVNKELPASFTAGRNIVFMALAGSYAFQIKAGAIVSGVCQTDYSGYPDCRRVFVDFMENALRFGLDDHDLFIDTPLMFLTKAETWKLAKDMGKELEIDGVKLIREMTLTDYNGNQTLNDWGRGQLDNPASVLREKGYREAQVLGYI